MMKRSEILEKLQDIFIDLLDDEDFALSEETSMETVPEWDSLLHITLIASVEDEFKIKIGTDEIAKAKSVGILADIIEQELA